MTSLNTQSEPVLLEMRSITKEFPGVKALSDVSLQGEGRRDPRDLRGKRGRKVHPDEGPLRRIPLRQLHGDIVYQSEVQQFKDIRASEHAGIVIIHQELALIPELSITENIFLGNEPTKRGVIDWAEARTRSRELLARVGLREDPDTPIKEIGVGKQQLVEIAKALNKSVKLLILDEPTAALNESDSQHLLDLILGLKGRGITSIIISHKLNEIEQIADEITIIRDGKSIETLNVKADGVDEDRIIKGMVGRTLESRFPDHEPKIGEVLFEVKNWNVGTRRSRTAWSARAPTSTSAGARSWASPGSWAPAAPNWHGRCSAVPTAASSAARSTRRQGTPPQERQAGHRRRARLRHGGPEVAGPEPAGRHQNHHSLGRAAQDQQLLRGGCQQGIHRG
jgi:putative multiple sugar transport system ATP-binding protein